MAQAFVQAAREGRLNDLKRMVEEQGFNPTKEPLSIHAAVESGNIEVLRYLTGIMGMDVNRPNDYRATPLIIAAEKNRTDMATTLLDSGANPNAEDSVGGVTPLLLAIEKDNVELVKLLLTYGAKAQAYHLLYAKSPPVAEILLGAGLDVNGKDTYGRTALRSAVKAKNADVTAFLLSKGADPNYAATPFEYTTLFIAISQKWPEGIKMLLPVVDVNAETFRGYAIFFAIQQNSPEVVKTLVENSNVDVNKRMQLGETPLMEVVKKGDEWIDAARAIIAKGADVNKGDLIGITPLVWAVILGSVNLTTLLLENGADINLKNTQGATALMYAVNHDRPNLVRLLLDEGADINAATNDGNYTPLILAAMKDAVDIAKFLIEMGADKNYRAPDGQTAMDLAKSESMQEALGKPARIWKGKSKGDIELFDTFFEGDNLINFSMCPICLGYTERADGCRYMHHNCKDQKGTMPHERLYSLYKNESGTVYWCTICGRSCFGHRHFQFVPHDQTTLPELAPIPEGGDFFGGEAFCLKDGGGGIKEKVKRLNQLIAKTKDLQAQVGTITEREAREQLTEAAWDAPLLDIPVDTILAEKKFTTSKEDFPAEVAESEAAAPVADVQKPADEAANIPEEVPQGMDAFTLEDVSPAIRFVHKKKDGTVYRHTDNQLVGKDGLTMFIKDMLPKFGLDTFGYCFADPDCDGKMWPQDIQPYITDPEVFATYKARFNQKFAPMEGGEDVPPILVRIDNASCALPKKAKAKATAGRKMTYRKRKASRKQKTRK